MRKWRALYIVRVESKGVVDGCMACTTFPSLPNPNHTIVAVHRYNVCSGYKKTLTEHIHILQILPILIMMCCDFLDMVHFEVHVSNCQEVTVTVAFCMRKCKSKIFRGFFFFDGNSGQLWNTVAAVGSSQVWVCLTVGL